jgi:hypothetical protein
MHGALLGVLAGVAGRGFRPGTDQPLEECVIGGVFCVARCFP